MDNMPERIGINRIKYHRNGVGGEGFFVFEFTFFDDECNYRDMIATVFPEGDDIPSYYAVLDKNDATYRWRGDHFIYALWEKFRELEKDPATKDSFYSYE